MSENLKSNQSKRSFIEISIAFSVTRFTSFEDLASLRERPIHSLIFILALKR